MSGPDATQACPEWCVRDHHSGPDPLRHLGEATELARPEAGSGAYTARLASEDNGPGYAILIECCCRRDWHIRMTLEAMDTLLDALDDGGQVAIQRLAHLIVQGADRSPRSG